MTEITNLWQALMPASPDQKHTLASATPGADGDFAELLALRQRLSPPDPEPFQANDLVGRAFAPEAYRSSKGDEAIDLRFDDSNPPGAAAILSEAVMAPMRSQVRAPGLAPVNLTDPALIPRSPSAPVRTLDSACVIAPSPAARDHRAPAATAHPSHHHPSGAPAEAEAPRGELVPARRAPAPTEPNPAPLAPAAPKPVPAASARSPSALQGASLPVPPTPFKTNEAMATLPGREAQSQAAKRMAPPAVSSTGGQDPISSSIGSDRASSSLKQRSAPRLEAMRAMILEQARQQSNASPVHVAVVAGETGLRILVRAGAMAETERQRLKESITALLADSGLTGADLSIHITTHAGAGAKEE